MIKILSNIYRNPLDCDNLDNRDPSMTRRALGHRRCPDIYTGLRQAGTDDRTSRTIAHLVDGSCI